MFPFACWRFTSDAVSFPLNFTSLKFLGIPFVDPLAYFLRLIQTFSFFFIADHFHVDLEGSSFQLAKTLTCSQLWMQIWGYFEVRKVRSALGNGDLIIILSILLVCFLSYLWWWRSLNNNDNNCLYKKQLGNEEMLVQEYKAPVVKRVSSGDLINVQHSD